MVNGATHGCCPGRSRQLQERLDEGHEFPGFIMPALEVFQPCLECFCGFLLVGGNGGLHRQQPVPPRRQLLLQAFLQEVGRQLSQFEIRGVVVAAAGAAARGTRSGRENDPPTPP